MDERKYKFDLEQEAFDIEERDNRERQKQRQWLVSLLEEKVEDGQSKYRLNEPVPLPERRDYLVKISSAPLKPIGDQDTVMTLFNQKVEGIKAQGAMDSHTDEIGVVLNLKDYLGEVFSTVKVPKTSFIKIGEVSEKKIPLELIAVEIPEQAVLSVEFGEETQKVLAEVKLQTERIVGQNISLEIDSDINSEFILPEDFILPKVVLPAEPVKVQMITEQTVKAVKDSVKMLEVYPEKTKLGIEDKLDMTLPTVEPPSFVVDKFQPLDVSEFLDEAMSAVKLTPVNVEIRNLAEEICGLPEERNGRKIAEMMNEMASFTVSMPDFTDIWETLK